MKFIYKIYLFLMIIFSLSTLATKAEIINKINVEGNQRISSETIQMFSGTSINEDLSENDLNDILKKLYETNLEEEYTPKLFSEEQNFESKDTNQDGIEDNDAEQLFDKENTEDEDFEIPAFLRRQKF